MSDMRAAIRMAMQQAQMERSSALEGFATMESKLLPKATKATVQRAKPSARCTTTPTRRSGSKMGARFWWKVPGCNANVPSHRASSLPSTISGSG